MLKALTFFVYPSNLLLVGVLLTGLWTVARPSRQGIIAFSAFASLLAAAAFTPIGFHAVGLLEHRFPEWKKGAAPVAGIVMLDGRIDRLPYGLALARAYPNARVVFSGKPDLVSDPFKLLLADGLNPAIAADDRRSTDTHENAVESLSLAKPKPGETWLLVTSASHMPRAVASFRAVGFPVRAAPVGFETNGGLIYLPRASDSLGMCDEAFHEVLGLVGYRLTGRTRELWPKP